MYDVKKKDVIARKHLEAYQTAAWLLRRVVNLSLKETADLFVVSPSRISHIQKAIESAERTKKQCEAGTPDKFPSLPHRKCMLTQMLLKPLVEPPFYCSLKTR